MLKILSFFFYVLVIAVTFANAQNCNICDFESARINQNTTFEGNCSNKDNLTDEETLAIMECLLNQKGNKTTYIGVVLRNNVSDTFASSPVEVVALFYISYLFYGNNNFANAMVLTYDYDLENPNPQKAIKIAHNSYRKWFKKIKKVGLKKARELKLDPLSKTKVSWV